MGTLIERVMSAEIVAAQQLEEAARFLDVEKWIVRRLCQCEREITVNMEIMRDNGEPMMFRGERVQHCRARGPYMGPLMFSKEFSAADGRALAMHLTWQSALWQLPFGGSAGWIAASIEDLSEREARLLTRAYVQALGGAIGSDVDVVTPERGGHREVNAWAFAAMGKAERETLAAVTGKPGSIGGVDREKIAAMFLRAVIGMALRDKGSRLAGARVAIAGFGVEARTLAAELETSGARIVAVSDSSGAVFNGSGLNLSSLLEYVEKDVVFGFPEAQSMSTEEMMQLPNDVLVLTPGERLTRTTEASVVVEAGGSVDCMLGKGMLMIPAILGDAGLRIADFLEWRKSACELYSERELMRGVEGHVRKTWSEIQKYARRFEITMGEAAMALAVSRVAEAMRMR